MGRMVVWLIFLLILSVMVLFTLPNTHQVRLNYYLDSIQLPLAVLLLISLSVGVLLGIIFNLTWVWNLTQKNKKLRKNSAHSPEDAA